MKMNLKNIILICAGLVLSVALSVVTLACSSASPVTTSSSTTTTTITTTAGSTTTSTTTTAQRPGANGTIAAINGDTLTLTTRQGQVTVNVSSSTTIEKTVSGTIDDLGQGDFVTISGTTDNTGNLDATSIMIRPQGETNQSFPTTGTPPANGGGFTTPSGTFGGGAGRQFTIGTISSVSGNNLTVTTSQAQVTVTVGTNTVIQKTISGTLADLSVGDSVSAVGPTDSSGNIDATSISIRPQGQGFPTTQSTTTS